MEAVYYKAAGAQNCPQGEIVDSVGECKIAGQALNYAFEKEGSRLCYTKIISNMSVVLRSVPRSPIIFNAFELCSDK